jgi:hypothetical protein
MRKLIRPLSILLLTLILFLNAEQNASAQGRKELQNRNKVTFKHTKASAILIGKSIKLLNKDLKVIGDIMGSPNTFFEITGVSDTIYNDTKDICNAYWYVKIKVDNKEGIVNGRYVFKLESSNKDMVFSINGKKVEFLTTTCMAMGVEYLGDLMACPVDQPVVFKDENNNFSGLVNVIPNNYYKQAIVNQDFAYFQLRNDNGYSDKIVAATPYQWGIKLSIHRSFQEGENNYDVLLKYKQGKYTAEYLNYGKIKYD